MRLLLIIPIIVICHHGILYETGQDKKISSLLFIIYLIRSIQLSLCLLMFADDIGYLYWSVQLGQLLDWTGQGLRQCCFELHMLIHYVNETMLRA